MNCLVSRHWLRYSVSLFSIVMALEGCAITQKSPVDLPGVSAISIKSLTDSPHPPSENNILEADVLSALKCQMYRGFEKVEDLKVDPLYSGHPNVAKFTYKGGTGTFSGKMTTVETANGKMNAIIPFVPFSGWIGSTQTPSIAGSLSSQGMREVKRSFDINPSTSINPPAGITTPRVPPLVVAGAEALCDELETAQVDVGNFITDAIVSAFTSTMRVRTVKNRDGTIAALYLPLMSISSNEITASFTVSHKKEGGFALSLIAAAPDLTSLGPSTTINSDTTGVYTVNLKLPTKVAIQNDSRRLHYCVKHKKGMLCLEGPYTDKGFEGFQLILDGAGKPYRNAKERKELLNMESIPGEPKEVMQFPNFDESPVEF